MRLRLMPERKLSARPGALLSTSLLTGTSSSMLRRVLSPNTNGGRPHRHEAPSTGAVDFAPRGTRDEDGASATVWSARAAARMGTQGVANGQ